MPKAYENRIGRLVFVSVGLTIDEIAKSKSGRKRFKKLGFNCVVLKKVFFNIIT